MVFCVARGDTLASKTSRLVSGPFHLDTSEKFLRFVKHFTIRTRIPGWSKSTANLVLQPRVLDPDTFVCAKGSFCSWLWHSSLLIFRRHAAGEHCVHEQLLAPASWDNFL